MKHIAMIANDTAFAFNLRREILTQLVQRGYCVTLVAEETSYTEELKEIGCRLELVQTDRQGTSVLQDIRLFFRYLQILHRIKPNLVLSNNIKPNVYGGLACQILDIPYIPNITGLGKPVEYPGPMQKLTTFLYKIGIRGAKTVLFQNSENEQFFRDRKMLPAKAKAILLPGSGVNLQTHPVMEYPKDEKIRFLFAARIMKEKGIDQFLAAARKFHAENCEFIVVGGCDDPNYREILHKADVQGVIVYRGLQKDVTPFYEQCNCFLYPSYYPEGMSNVLLEAAACGRPVIAADRSGCRETVENGVSGYLVPIQDEPAVLEAIEKFLSLTWEEQRAMGLAGRAKMEREFDRNFVVEKYLEELE